MNTLTKYTPSMRAARNAEKRRAILRHLRDEIYTTREVVQELLGVASTPAKMIITSMAREGLVRCEQVECPNGSRPHLVGITSEGQGHAFELGEAPSDRVFEPGRVGLTVVTHTLTLQLARIRAERAGWSQWKAGDRAGMWGNDKGRPDAVAIDPHGEAWAVEVELTMKTKKRYESVLFDRLRQIRENNFSRIVWISPDAERSRRLESIIKSIDEFTREVNGTKQQIRIDPETHHPKLSFVPLDHWINFSATQPT